MREWSELSLEERQAERAKAGGTRYDQRVKMDTCFQMVIGLLGDDSFAQAKAWKLTWGNYLINTPEEIAAHCRAAAHGKAVS